MRRRAIVVVLGVAGVVILGAAGVGGFLLATRTPTPTTALGAPVFVDDTGASGLAHTYGGDYTASLGGGIAVLDCDEDGRPDLFVAGGDNPAGLYRNESAQGGTLRFARLDDPVTGATKVMGGYPLDIDGDGHVDLAVLRVGGADLLRGLGGCRFERANDAWSFAAPSTWVTAFSATWEGDTALPTLGLGSYVGLDAAGETTYTCPDNLLYRPDTAGSGYAAAIPLSPGYCPLSMLFSDWDGSGRRDLRLSNDRHYYDNVNGEEQLWRVAPGETPRAYDASDGWVQMQIWGMGIASQDITGDGLPEIYLTSQGDNKLQTLLAGPATPTYRDIALKRGVIGTHPVNGGDPLPSTAWHPEFDDVNNDGFVDLYVSKGNIDRVPDYATRDPSNLFLGQPDGTFIEAAAAAGIVDYDRTRGASLSDLNGDGLLDLVEVKVNAPVRLWRNVGSGTAAEPRPIGGWLGVRLREPGPNRDAIGAVIEVKVGDAVLRREIVVGGGHIGGKLGPAHFGLGDATRVEARVTWPDGEQGPWLPVDANQVVEVDRGAGTVTPVATPGG
jgi:enediyne biosynthesis protein E4